MAGHRRGVTAAVPTGFARARVPDPVLVAAGGAVGASIRWGLLEALHADAGWPTWTLLANLVGCAVLGALRGRRRSTTLLLGTGLAGGLTTFSTLAYEVTVLWERDGAVAALTYPTGSVLLGLLAHRGAALVAARWRR